MLSNPRRQSVLRASAVVVALSSAIPFYYGLINLIPALGRLVPAVVAHVTTGVGLLVAFPGMIAYAQIQERRSDDGDAAARTEYGVNDQWERRNL